MTSHWVDDSNAALVTDFYELTMLQAYFDAGMNDTAVFDLFVRRLPPNRNYLVACGLEHVLHYLETLYFSSQALDYLASLDRFSNAFVKSLADFKFTGDVYAMPEGTVVFPNEPIIEVVAPIPQAQLIETFVMNQIQLSTLAASKAARVVTAARGRQIVDFGLRRMHGADAGIKAPRAFYIAGVNATSSVAAGRMFGLPVSGTMAHSFVQAFESELDAFRSFVKSHPGGVLLIDTYDTLKGVQHVIDLARELGSAFHVSGVRLDSGDLAELSKQVRKMLDDAGLHHLKIFASSSLDEYVIEELLSAGAPFDGFGVGAHMATSQDAPFLDTAYKLVEYAGRPTMKLSLHKSNLPGRKQVFREKTNGKAKRDVIGLADEHLGGEPQLLKFMENGRRVGPPEPVDASRTRCSAEIRVLPEALLSLDSADPIYPVEISPNLARLRDDLSRKW